jgi:uncharacterized protein YecE (DUF72 family)
MDLLGEKLGPLLFQFGYFNKRAFRSLGEFLTRLEPFLKRLPSGYRFAPEVRNGSWMDARLAEVLRSRNVALALVDHAWMPRPSVVFEKLDPVTADFAYIRWLGDRKGIEKRRRRGTKPSLTGARNWASGWRSAIRLPGAACLSSPLPTIITRGTVLPR